ncbi:hypothetical protein LXL04_018863 [Taraxacum kok-saghyz]
MVLEAATVMTGGELKEVKLFKVVNLLLITYNAMDEREKEWQERSELRNLCGKLGNLADIYIAGRRDASGAFFALLKFDKVEKPEEIEEGLSKLICRGTLGASRREVPNNRHSTVGRFSHAPRDFRTFAEVARGMAARVDPPPARATHTSSPASNLIDLPCIKEISVWAGKDVLIGEAKCFDSLCNFPSLVTLEGYEVAEVKYMGGMQVLIKFHSERAATVFKSNKAIWLKWFLRVDDYGKKNIRFERIAWLKTTGLPLAAWDDANFATIVRNYGKLLVNSCSFWSTDDVSHGRVCILTANRKKIIEELDFKCEGSLIKIGISELDDGWTPFKPFVEDCDTRQNFICKSQTKL